MTLNTLFGVYLFQSMVFLGCQWTAFEFVAYNGGLGYQEKIYINPIGDEVFVNTE